MGNTKLFYSSTKRFATVCLLLLILAFSTMSSFKEVSIDFSAIAIVENGLEIISGTPDIASYNMENSTANSNVREVTEDLIIELTDSSFLTNQFSIVDVELIYYLPSNLATEASRLYCRDIAGSQKRVGQFRGGMWFDKKNWRTETLEFNFAQFNANDTCFVLSHVNNYAIKKLVLRGYATEKNITWRRMIRCTSLVYSPHEIFAIVKGNNAQFEIPFTNLAKESYTFKTRCFLKERLSDDKVTWNKDGEISLAGNATYKLPVVIPTGSLRYGAYDLQVQATGIDERWSDTILTDVSTYCGIISEKVIPKAKQGEFLYGLDMRLVPPFKDTTERLLKWTRVTGTDIIRNGFYTWEIKYPNYDLIGQITKYLPLYESYDLKNVFNMSPPEPNNNYQSNMLQYGPLLERTLEHAERIARAFPQFKYWEIGNEPDIGFYNGPKEQYGLDFMKIYAAIKKGNANTIVMNGGFVSSLESQKYENMIKIINTIDADSIDAWAYHGHGPLKNEKESNRRLMNVLDSIGKGGKPLIQTESGRYHLDRDGEMSQALTCPQKMIYAQSQNMPLFLWFRLDFEHPESIDYGCLKHHDYRQPKPVVFAYRSMVEILRGYVWVDSLVNDNFEGHHFYNSTNESHVFAAWTNNNPGTFSIQISDGYSSLFSPETGDMFGNFVPATVTKSSIVELDVSPYPVYFRFKASGKTTIDIPGVSDVKIPVLKIRKNNISTIEIFDMLGRKVFCKELKNTQPVHRNRVMSKLPASVIYKRSKDLSGTAIVERVLTGVKINRIGKCE